MGFTPSAAGERVFSQGVTIGAWQRQLRKWVLRITVRRAAELVGVHKTAVYPWIRAKDPVMPSRERCLRIEEAMGLDPEWDPSVN